MGSIVVFDADVLIGYLTYSDAHHERAVATMRAARVGGTRRRVSAVTFSEILIGPLRAGGEPAAVLVEDMLADHAIDVVPADRAAARAAADVRARTTLSLPDAYAVATALAAGMNDVRLESFDREVVRAYEALAAQH